MLEVAKTNIDSIKLSEAIEVIKMPVIDLDEKFQDKSFDKVTASLSFSELYQKEQEFLQNMS